MNALEDTIYIVSNISLNIIRLQILDAIWYVILDDFMGDPSTSSNDRLVLSGKRSFWLYIESVYKNLKVPVGNRCHVHADVVTTM
jgi:hypothetical protein